ncbi:MAG: SLBB domain-containing protein [Planctomycetota bacterium]
MSLSAVARPGVVEVPLGTSVRRILEEGGGGAPAGRRWSMALIGGPMGRAGCRALVRRRALVPGSARHGSCRHRRSMIRVAGRLARYLFQFTRRISGNRTPCRAGSAQLAEMRDARAARLLDTMELGSLCGFGVWVCRGRFAICSRPAGRRCSWL